MKTAILVCLLSAVLASENHENFLRSQKGYDPNEIKQDELLFANQFKDPFLQDKDAKVEATKEKLENYAPEIDAAETIDDFLIKTSKLGEFFKGVVVPNRSKQNRDIVPAFKVAYNGKEFNEDDRNKSISHNGLEYELSYCSICTEYSQNPKIICMNKHSFCKLCLDHMHKSIKGIKCCPNCRALFEGIGDDELEKYLTPELQVHLSNQKALIKSMSRAVIYFSFMVLAYLFGLKAVGFAFQTFSFLMASFAPLPAFRLFKGEHIKSVTATGDSDQKAMIAVVIAFLLANFGIGIYTVGSWTTLFGFILLFPLVKLLQLKIAKKKNE